MAATIAPPLPGASAAATAAPTTTATWAEPAAAGRAGAAPAGDEQREQRAEPEGAEQQPLAGELVEEVVALGAGDEFGDGAGAPDGRQGAGEHGR